MRMFLLLPCLLLAAPALAQTPAFSSLEERMTEAEFRAAGMHKLSPSELAALNVWLDRNVRLAEPPPTSSQSPAATVAQQRPTATASDQQIGLPTTRQEQEVSSVIEGRFTGWTGSTVFRLANGQVWQQSDGRNAALSLQDPEVAIKPGALGTWRMHVVGTNRSVRVKRIR